VKPQKKMLKSLRLNQHRWSRKKKLSKKILPARACLSADKRVEASANSI